MAEADRVASHPIGQGCVILTVVWFTSSVIASSCISCKSSALGQGFRRGRLGTPAQPHCSLPKAGAVGFAVYTSTFINWCQCTRSPWVLCTLVSGCRLHQTKPPFRGIVPFTPFSRELWSVGGRSYNTPALRGDCQGFYSTYVRRMGFSGPF